MDANSGQGARPTLLSLPFDARSLIYDALLQEDREPPASPADLPDTGCLFPFWLSHSSFIHHPPPPRPVCHGLLGSCRQIREEITQRLQLERARGSLRCRMDCMLLRNSELFPSWTWFPAPPRYLDTLHVDLRILTADAEGANVAKLAGGFLNEPAFKLAELLEEFFHRGPTYRPVSVLRNDIRMKRVVVDVVPPPEVPGEVLQVYTAQLDDGSPHPAEVFRSLASNYILPRALRANVHSLVVHYMDSVYNWNVNDDQFLMLTKAQKRMYLLKHNQAVPRHAPRRQRASKALMEPQRRSARRRTQPTPYGRPDDQG